jgi:hypothetical protein
MLPSTGCGNGATSREPSAPSINTAEAAAENKNARADASAARNIFGAQSSGLLGESGGYRQFINDS